MSVHTCKLVNIILLYMGEFELRLSCSMVIYGYRQTGDFWRGRRGCGMTNYRIGPRLQRRDRNFKSEAKSAGVSFRTNKPPGAQL